MTLVRLIVIYEEEFDMLKQGDIVYDKHGKEIIIDDVYHDGDMDCMIAYDVNEDYYFAGDLYWKI